MEDHAAQLPQDTSRNTGPCRFEIPFGVFLLSVACFTPAMRNGFVNWDDPGNFLTNTAYQTASAEAVRWAFTTRLMGHYQPLNWLSFIADHAVGRRIGPAGPCADDDPYLKSALPKSWPNEPPSAGRFHQTQAILHGIAAMLVYFLARRVQIGASAREAPVGIEWASAFAALVFALHPLRVESVAWASARTDVLAAIFMLWATLVYMGRVGSAAHSQASISRRIAVALLMALAVGSKVSAVTLPVVLLILDYSLTKPAPGNNGKSSTRRFARLIAQKTELFVLSIIGVVVARWAHAGSVVDLESHPIAKRIAQVPVSLAFYPWKTLLPVNLSPLYEFPVGFDLTHALALWSIAGIAIALVLLALFVRPRGVWLAIIAYVVLIAPVSGLTQRGPQMVADRYSYLACIPFALLAGGIAARMARARTAATVSVCALVLIALVFQTQRQLLVWHDSVSLWTRAIEHDRTNATAHDGLGAAYAAAGKRERAIAEFETAVAIRPSQAYAWFSLGRLYSEAGQYEEAVRCFTHELANTPSHPKARLNLCMALADVDRLDEAEPHLRQLVADSANSEDTLIRHMLADVCAERGAFDEAVQHLDDAIAIARRKNLPRLIDVLTRARDAYAAEATTQPTQATP